mmetsp:Transcript_61683/g.98287  ORF Transcript_61683/g.98287 Transcript_61683/m.98287 type:complete len:241 (+) Transcript_61683:746-1468(+)
MNVHAMPIHLGRAWIARAVNQHRNEQEIRKRHQAVCQIHVDIHQPRWRRRRRRRRAAVAAIFADVERQRTRRRRCIFSLLSETKSVSSVIVRRVFFVQFLLIVFVSLLLLLLYMFFVVVVVIVMLFRLLLSFVVQLCFQRLDKEGVAFQDEPGLLARHNQRAGDVELERPDRGIDEERQHVQCIAHQVDVVRVEHPHVGQIERLDQRKEVHFVSPAIKQDHQSKRVDDHIQPCDDDGVVM